MRFQSLILMYKGFLSGIPIRFSKHASTFPGNYYSKFSDILSTDKPRETLDLTQVSERCF